jgi:hypothetical protein
MVRGKADARIANATVDDDTTWAGQYSRHAVIADAVGVGSPDRIGDLAHDRLHHQIVSVGPQGLALRLARQAGYMTS